MSNDSVDLFVVLAELGRSKGDCDAAALRHIAALHDGNTRMAKERAHDLREALLRLQLHVERAIELFDSGALAVYGDQFQKKGGEE